MSVKHVRKYDGFEIVEFEGQDGVEIIILDHADESVRPHILEDTLYNHKGEPYLMPRLPNSLNTKV